MPSIPIPPKPPGSNLVPTLKPIPAWWVKVKPGWPRHTPKQMMERFDRLNPAERLSLNYLHFSPSVNFRAPSNQWWVIRLPGGTGGHLLGQGSENVTILGEGMTIEYDVDITAYYFAGLQARPSSKRASSDVDSTSYEISFALDYSLDILFAS